MLLKDYIPDVDNKFKNFFFWDFIRYKKVKKDNIFFAIKGANIDGNNFITSAIKKGSK